jgi:hypothetical protein
MRSTLLAFQVKPVAAIAAAERREAQAADEVVPEAMVRRTANIVAAASRAGPLISEE